MFPPQGQKPGLHLDTDGAPQPSMSVTAPPSLQPFFDDMSDGENQSTLLSSLKVTAPLLSIIMSPAQSSPHVADFINPFSLFLLSFHLFITPSWQREEVCPPYDRHTLFTPPSPKPNTSRPTRRSRVCPPACLSFHFLWSFFRCSVSVPLTHSCEIIFLN